MASALNPGACGILKCMAISLFTSPMVPMALGSSTAGEEDWGFSPAQQCLRAVVLPLFELTARKSTKLWHLTILCGKDRFRSSLHGSVSSVMMAQSRADDLDPDLAAERLEMKHLALHFTPSPQKAVKAWTHLCLQCAWFCYWWRFELLYENLKCFQTTSVDLDGIWQENGFSLSCPTWAERAQVWLGVDLFFRYLSVLMHNSNLISSTDAKLLDSVIVVAFNKLELLLQWKQCGR